MRCPGCERENSDKATFCRECGQRLSLLCSSCGSKLEVGVHYCDSCGTPIEDPDSTIERPRPAPSQARPEKTDFKGGRYIVKDFLGAGATKTVYLVHDTVLDRHVALSLVRTEGMDELELTRIGREAQTLAKLGDHRNIVPIYDIGDEDGQPFMVMPDMSGGAVQGLVKGDADERPDLDTVLRLATDICRGLEFAHSNGVIHRDLKPGNVWLTADGVANIGDFGIAISSAQARLTEPGQIVGTVAYISPEQAEGGALDERSDLYSLGAMLYELTTGVPPFSGDHPVAIIRQHIHDEPPPPRSLNQECPLMLETLVLRLLAKDPADRPQSATDVLDALDEIKKSSRVRGSAVGSNSRKPTELRVLLVEDSEDDALLVMRELRRGGYEPVYERVDTPADMKAAAENGSWDLIISDYSMPNFSAPAALKLMQYSGLDLPFIIASGTISEEAAVEAMRAGAHDFVMKGNLTRLIPAVERELREAEERRERRRVQDELRRLYREMEERREELEQRVTELIAQNRRLEKQLAQQRPMANVTDEVKKRLKSISQEADELARLAEGEPSRVPGKASTSARTEE